MFLTNKYPNLKNTIMENRLIKTLAQQGHDKTSKLH